MEFLPVVLSSTAYETVVVLFGTGVVGERGITGKLESTWGRMCQPKSDTPRGKVKSPVLLALL